MRVKDYDYDTVVKFKNPLRDFDVVLDFIENNFECINKIELVPGYKILHYVNNKYGIIALYDLDEEELSFFNYLKNIEGTFYVLGNKKMPYIAEEKGFENLKAIFLKHKLNEKLNSELSHKEQPIKKKVNKI